MSTTDAQQVARESSAAMVAADSAARSTGVRIVEIGPGHATAALTVAGQHVNGHGVCHGGVLFLLADTAMAHACNSYGTSAVASGADIAFLRPASLGDELTASATERALAGRSGLYDVSVRTGDGTVVAEFRGRTRRVPGLAPPPRVEP
ncbi:hydroxyphenylacetyl-CoA thioesterase PaaI [Pseudonocardia sp. KRD291]|uniref:hydroxyphenylacetyl-CoA thioesterase PaaI n=1 Tax=Pseudonocardia sp. KRD291 TaxID=2792007 RepID=UPI001C5C7187|nr:hydroxyphenylacetyl-CoA thioesterase PaaI [Pseudonocardia sp. KRD291]MBW0103818.1 hydroxyphenylacetyl-CoA thioesterase PaaI [Pseudonocardia sp. KRD291]